MSKYCEKEKVREIYSVLRSMGHHITVDWTGHEAAEPNTMQAYAMEDVAGVRAADRCIAYVVNDHNYNGARSEFGMAIAWNKTVYVVGDKFDSNIFIHLPNVFRFDTLEQLYKELPRGEK